MALVGNISGSIQNNSNIGVSGSVVIANRPDALFPTLSSVGDDVVFFVSGSRGGKGSTAERTVSVFGGDAVVSGSLTIGTGSITITSNDITFAGGVTQIFSGSGGLTFKDDSGSVTLASLIAGSSTQPEYWTSITANEIYTTGSAVISGSLTVKDGSGNSVITGDTSGNLTIGGDLRINGNDIKSSTGNIAITLSDESVIIPGDLTVLGTTTTINTDQLVIEDPLIYFASGSTSSNQNGGIAIASGSSVTDQALVWGRVADDVWGAGIKDVTAGTTSDLTTMTLTPVRASQFQMGGAADTPAASDSAYLSSSDALNVLVNYKDTATFTKAGVQAVQITDYLGSTGEGMIKGVNALGLAELWLSGTTVSIGAGTTSFVGSDDLRLGTITGPLGGNGLTLTAQDGSSASRQLVLSGSSVVLGANNAAQGVEFKTEGTTVMLEVNSPLANNLVIRGGTSYTTASLLNTNAAIVNFAGAATTVTIGSSATAPGSTTIQNKFVRSGNISRTAWTTSGASADIAASTLTDTTSGGGSTIATRVATSVNTPTFASTNPITVTNAANLYVSAAPLAGTNTTITNSYAAWINGQSLLGGNVLPSQDVTYNLGSAQLRWANIYTGDLHLKNDRGDYTLIEEEDFLSIRFNKTGKRYKFVLEPVPELDEK